MLFVTLENDVDHIMDSQLEEDVRIGMCIKQSLEESNNRLKNNSHSMIKIQKRVME